MEDLKHTPGSWNLTTDIEDYNITGTSADIAIVNKNTCINKEEALANAKLISTAPELLKVLYDSLTQLERLSKIIPNSAKYDNMAQSLDDHFCEVRKAIEKATT